MATQPNKDKKNEKKPKMKDLTPSKDAKGGGGHLSAHSGLTSKSGLTSTTSKTAH